MCANFFRWCTRGLCLVRWFGHKDLAFFNDGISGFQKGLLTATTLWTSATTSFVRWDVTLMVLAGYSKAFDTVSFRYVIHKMHFMRFLRTFFNAGCLHICAPAAMCWDWRYKCSGQSETKFGVPQGTIYLQYICGFALTQSSRQAPFTSEIVDSILVTDSNEKSQRSVESCGFSPSAPVSSHWESCRVGWDKHI